MAAACAAVLLVASLVRAPESPSNLAATPADIPAEPQPAAALVAADGVTPEPATSFAAPFAAGTRADPYFVDVPTTRSSPFALTPLPDDPAQFEFAPVSLWEVPRLQVESRFLPASESARAPRRQSVFFRTEGGDPAPAAVAPVSLQVEP